jgi:diguanylate cyclase (GGDEF)-like protein
MLAQTEASGAIGIRETWRRDLGVNSTHQPESDTGLDFKACKTLFHLACQLQTTLELKRLIDLFRAHVATLLPKITVEYSELKGKTAPKSISNDVYAFAYNLARDGVALGTITFSSPERLCHEHRHLLERSLRCLVCPLHNALLYREALDVARRDALTGVNNRTGLESLLRRETDLAERHGFPLSMIMLDIDRFKRINDVHGHQIGDCALRSVSERIIACIRQSDLVFRLGGDEFLIVLSNTDRAGAALLAERVRLAVQAMVIHCHRVTLKVTISLGVASLGHGNDHIELLENADQALYRAKACGRNRVITAHVQERMPNSDQHVLALDPIAQP